MMQTTEQRTPLDYIDGGAPDSPEVVEVGHVAGVGHAWHIYLELVTGREWRYVVMQWPNRSLHYIQTSWLKEQLNSPVDVEVFRPDSCYDFSDTEVFDAAWAYALAEARQEIVTEGGAG